MHKQWELRGGTLLQTETSTKASESPDPWHPPRTIGPLVAARPPRTVAELSRRSCLRGSLELEAM
jgi:hypothetical protein